MQAQMLAVIHEAQGLHMAWLTSLPGEELATNPLCATHCEQAEAWKKSITA